MELPAISSHFDQAHQRRHSLGLCPAGGTLVDGLSLSHAAALRLHGGPIVCDITLGIIPLNGSLRWFALGNGNRREEKSCAGPFVKEKEQHV